jgi:hypothetical protein
MRHGLFSMPGVAALVGGIIIAGMFTLCQSDTSQKKTTTDTTASKPVSPPVRETQSEQPNTDSGPSVTAPRKLTVYYFHGNYRCRSCTMIENLTKQAVNSGFAKELKNGRMDLQVINIEEPGNEHFAQDYKLYTKSVILSDKVNGKEQSWKNLDKVWTLLGDPDKFIDYIQTEVQTLL